MRDLETLDFTAQDRCDKCGHQAHILCEKFQGDKELLFCAHHGRRYAGSLRERGWRITEDAEALDAMTPENVRSFPILVRS